MKPFPCRICNSPVTETFADLGTSPLANAMVNKEEVSKKDDVYPLRACVCSNCLLVQLDVFASPEKIFEEYSYFSSFSKSWLMAAKEYAQTVVDRFHYDKNSLVVEIGSNDGYLLGYFQEKGVSVLGIEPAINVAETAIKKGIPTRKEFFGEETAKKLVSENYKADHIAIKNVLAHVPNLHDFIKGMKHLLKEDGTICIEFPHLLKLIEFNQFDTIYHEHFCYFSLLTVEKAFEMNGLNLFDVEEIDFHGGSLRIWVKHSTNSRSIHPRVQALKDVEKAKGLYELSTYRSYQSKIEQTKKSLIGFLKEKKRQGARIAAYGAPAKGNTLLNYCGISTDLIDYTVDRNPYKQGRFLPGTHIPVYSPEKIIETKPDFLLILPWNFKEEIAKETSFIQRWHGKHVIPIPTVEILDEVSYEVQKHAA